MHAWRLKIRRQAGELPEPGAAHNLTAQKFLRDGKGRAVLEDFGLGGSTSSTQSLGSRVLDSVPLCLSLP
jgi:hypothetical protein